MTGDLLETSDPRWEDLLEGVDHDFYHLRGYVALEAERLGGRGALFTYVDGPKRFLLPLVFRPVEVAGQPVADLWDASSPYGYPCPLIRAEAESRAGFAAEATSALVERLAAEDVVSLFVRMHPLMPVGEAVEAALAEVGTLCHHGDTVWLDLSEGADEQFREVRTRWRTLLRKYRREGPHARLDASFEHLDRFVELYYQTMDHAGASKAYYFERAYFERLRQVLGERLRLCVVDEDGGPYSGVLVTVSCGIAQYHLAANAIGKGCKDGPKIAIDFLRGWAAERGARALHLGGGVGGREDDSLFYFKSGFSKKRAPFHTWRAVTSASGYDRLCALWAERSGELPPTSLDGFFPAYRRPI